MVSRDRGHRAGQGDCHLSRPPFGPKDGHVCGVCSRHLVRSAQSRCSLEVWRDNELSTRSCGPRGKPSLSRRALLELSAVKQMLCSVLSCVVATSHLWLLGTRDVAGTTEALIFNF